MLKRVTCLQTYGKPMGLNVVEMCMHLVQTFMLLFIRWILFSNFICFDLDAYEHVALEAFNAQTS